MNRLKKIFAALSEIGIVPPSAAIRHAWCIARTTLDAHQPVTTPGVASEYAQAVKLIDRIVGAVIGIADEQAAPKAQKADA